MEPEGVSVLAGEGAAKGERARSSTVFALVCVGILLANMDLFSVNIALPRMARDFRGVRLDELSWVLNGYAIAYAALLVFFGRLAERFRRDRSFLLGLGGFSLAALACGLSRGVWPLVAFRVLAAVGAALMTPASLGLLLASYPPEKRAGAVRNWAAVGGLAAALGPLIGGLLASISWHLIFGFNAVVGSVAILVAWRKLPCVPGHPVPRPGLRPTLLITVGISLLIFAILKVHAWGWGSQRTLLSLLASLIALALFGVDCLRSSNPLIDPGLFRIRPFLGSVLALLPYSVTFGAMLFSVSIWGQAAWGWSALRAGLAIIPGPLLVPVTSLGLTGRLIHRFGPAWVVALGTAFVVAGFVFWATCIGVAPSVLRVALGMALNGIGVGLAYPTLMGAGTQALPPSAFATGSGVINMIRQAAMALGVALFVTLIGTPSTAAGCLAAFQRGWWTLAALTLLTLVPALVYLARGCAHPREGAAPNGDMALPELG